MAYLRLILLAVMTVTLTACGGGGNGENNANANTNGNGNGNGNGNDFIFDPAVTGQGNLRIAPDLETYPIGSIVTVTAVPESGFVFAGWGGSLSGTENPQTLIIDESTTLSISFTRMSSPPEFTLSTSATGQGSITLDPAGGTYPEGTGVTVTAVPATGYSFSGWSGALSGSNASQTLTISANTSVAAAFAEIPPASYSLSTSATGQGSITLDPAGGTYAEGTEVTVTAVPAAGYSFSGWSGALSGSNASQTLTISANTSVAAAFAEIPPASYSLSTSATGQGSITLDPAGGTYAEGTEVTVTAVPAAGYSFSGWSGALSGSNASQTLTISANTSVAAAFAEIPPASYSLTTSVTGQGTITLDPAGGTYPDGTEVTVTATPASGYNFSGWNGALSGNNASQTLTISANTSVAAAFAEIPPASYSLTTSVTGQGTITLDPAGGTYPDGTEVTVTATPASGYNFSGWSGALSGSNASRTLTVSANTSVTAAFAEIPPASYSLSTSVTGQGSITLDPAGGTYTEGTEVTVTATPASGYSFSGWGGDLSGSSLSTTITMNTDQSISAGFVATPTAGSGLVGYWPMDEASGTEVADASGNSLNATLTSEAGSHISGYQGNALAFDGSRYASISSPAVLEVNSFTISAFIRVDQSANRRWIAGHGDNYGLSLEPNGYLHVYFYNGSNYPGIWVNPPSDIRDQQWHHIAGTFDAATGMAQIYVDGVLAGESALQGSISYQRGTDFNIGSMNGNRLFEGEMDELRVYDRALSQTEIAALMIPQQQTISVSGGVLLETDSGATPAAFKVSLGHSASADINFDYQTVAGTATADTDYRSTSGSATIPAGSMEITIAVDILGDTTAESDEAFSLEISNVAGAVADVSSATFRIRNDDDIVSGLNARPGNTQCVAGDRPEFGSGDLSLSTVDAFPGVTFAAPVDMVQAPGDSSRFFVVELGGKIWVIENGVKLATPFLDISDNMGTRIEDGLYSIAFHPDYQNNGYFYISYVDQNEFSQIDRFTVSSNPNVADPASELTLIELYQPYHWHNNYRLAFGDDGYLYIAFGNGGNPGSGADPLLHSQDTSTLHGAMLRIDVDNGSPYAIPADNPFAGQSCDQDARTGNCPEIYAWGLRSPWRWSFDSLTGDLWLGDVGWGRHEEVNLVSRGSNLGWPCYEGDEQTSRFSAEPACPTITHTAPVTSFNHEDGKCAVTGGFVYRGNDIPALQGNYLYADLCTGTVYSLAHYTDPLATPQTRLTLPNPAYPYAIPAFAQDHDKELYILHFTGSIYKLVAASGGGVQANPNVPEQLSDSPCVDPADPSKASSAMIPYTINAEHWTDGAHFENWMSIPDGTTIDHQNAGDWEFPVGSVFMKNFIVGTRLVETRFLMRHNDGEWGGYTYEWNDTGTDATLVLGGKEKDIGGQIWQFPSGTQCLNCHTNAAGGALSPETAQMNRLFTYLETGVTANQIDTLEQIDLFAEIFPHSPQDLPVLVSPYDTSADLEDRARSWLHANCSSCHQPGGVPRIDMDFRFSTPLADMHVCNVEPHNGDWGVTGAKRMLPGNADLSLIHYRPGQLDDAQMPPFGTNLVDDAGRAVIRDWINSLSGCP